MLRRIGNWLASIAAALGADPVVGGAIPPEPEGFETEGDHESLIRAAADFIRKRSGGLHG